MRCAARMLIDLKQVKCIPNSIHECPTLQTEDKVTATCLSNPFRNQQPSLSDKGTVRNSDWFCVLTVC